MLNIKKQRGIATILIVLLIGIAMVATVAGTVYSVKNTQTQQVTSTTVLNSQALAWAAAEVLTRKIHSEADATYADQLVAKGADGANIVLKIPEMDVGSATANVVVESNGSNYVATITATTAIGSAAQSSALLQLVFGGGTPQPCPQPGGDNEFHFDLDGTGGITLEGCNGEGLDASVKGDAIFGSTAPKFRNLRATGDITISTSSTEVETLRANGNVTLTNGGYAKNVYSAALTTGSGAAGDNYAIKIDQGGQAVNLHANGEVYLGSGDTANVRSRAGVWVKGLSTGIDNEVHDVITAVRGEGAPLPFINYGYSRMGQVVAEGTISGITTDIKANVIISNSNFTCPANPNTSEGYWDHSVDPKVHPTFTVSGNLTGCDAYDLYSVAAGSFDMNSYVVPEVDPIKIDPISWNAYDFRSPEAEIPSASGNVANFYFYPDGTNIKVRVRSMLNITDGEYYYHPTTDNGNNRLCAAADECTVADPDQTLCWSNQDVPCITYSGNTFSVGGITLLPATYIFEGDLSVTQAHGFNSLLATADAQVPGGNRHLNEAINWAGTDAVCRSILGNPATANLNETVFGGIITDAAVQNALGYDSANPDAYVHTAFFDSYPTNICSGNTGTITYTSESIGNVSFAAGSRGTEITADELEAGNGVDNYNGGNITTGSNAEFYGLVIAGNSIQTSQDTKIFGGITALALDALNQTTNSFDNKIDVKYCADDAPAEYSNALPTPDKPGTPPACVGGGSGSASQLNLLWSRYL